MAEGVSPQNFATALLRYAAGVLGVPADDPETTAMSLTVPWSDLSIGGFPLDSLDVVEVLIAAGGEIGVDLPGVVEDTGAENALEVAQAVTEQCGAESVTAFCAVWG